MITLKERNQLAKTINKYAQSEVDVSWIGVGNAEDGPRVIQRNTYHRNRLMRLLDAITIKEPKK